MNRLKKQPDSKSYLDLYYDKITSEFDPEKEGRLTLKMPTCSFTHRKNLEENKVKSQSRNSFKSVGEFSIKTDRKQLQTNLAGKTNRPISLSRFNILGNHEIENQKSKNKENKLIDLRNDSTQKICFSKRKINAFEKLLKNPKFSQIFSNNFDKNKNSVKPVEPKLISTNTSNNYYFGTNKPRIVTTSKSHQSLINKIHNKPTDILLNNQAKKSINESKNDHMLLNSPKIKLKSMLKIKPQFKASASDLNQSFESSESLLFIGKRIDLIYNLL